jgi:hypothetical protein
VLATRIPHLDANPVPMALICGAAAWLKSMVSMRSSMANYALSIASWLQLHQYSQTNHNADSAEQRML